MPHCHVSNRPPFNSIPLVGLFYILTGCVMLAGCSPEQHSPRAQARSDTYFPIGIGGSTLQLQLALTPTEHRKGLMFRESLPPDHGMLFLFERAKRQSFWMRNTRIPLDIGYLDASGQLREIHKLFPFDETGVPSNSQHILMAIETNRDWYRKNEVSPDAQLDMEALKSAITERGFSTNAYAIEN